MRIISLSADSSGVEQPLERKKMAKSKLPTKFERNEAIAKRLEKLVRELKELGFSDVLPEPGSVKVFTPAIRDKKTGALIAHIVEPMGVYLQRVSIRENYSQRAAFDHTEDEVYRKLIKDFLEDSILPEARVAVLNRHATDWRSPTLEAKNGELRYSMIDGLQRLYCQGIAILLVYYRDKLINMGLIKQDTYNEWFRGVVETRYPDPEAGVRELLSRDIPWEVYYDLDLKGLLRWMIILNSGQKRMSLDVQLEIMQQPLLEGLSKEGIKIYFDQTKVSDSTKPKDNFAASDLIIGTKACLTANPQLHKSAEVEDFLKEERYLEKVGEVADLVDLLKRVTGELHNTIIEVHEENRKKYILSSSIIFFTAFMAACGRISQKQNFKILDGPIDRLIDRLRTKEQDPLNLEDYRALQQEVKASKGKTLRRLVHDTFTRYFIGATEDLDWKGTAASIAGF